MFPQLRQLSEKRLSLDVPMLEDEISNGKKHSNLARKTKNTIIERKQLKPCEDIQERDVTAIMPTFMEKLSIST